MMCVVLYDKMRETSIEIADVIRLNSISTKINGRYVGVWHLVKSDGTQRAFKQKDYTILSIVI